MLHRPHYAFRVIALGLLLITLAVNIAMPLFGVYARLAGFSNGQLALVLAAYITGMLPCLIFFGGISDKLGYKPVLAASVFFAFLATLIITLSPNIYALIVSRLFQGMALGLSMGTGTAYMAAVLRDDPSGLVKAANMASFSTSIGFSGGALATTLLLLNTFSLTPVSFYGLLLLTLVGLLLIAFLPAIPPKGGKLVRLPYFPPHSLPISMVVGISWACVGTVIAIIPLQLAAFGLTAYAGFSLVLINWTGAFIQPFIRNINPQKSLVIGYTLIPFAFGTIVLGCYLHILWVILAGTTLLGTTAYGFSYMSGITLISLAAGEHRARAVSGFMFIGYLGFGIPAILLGFLSDKIGIVGALLCFEAVIIALVAWGLMSLNKSKA